MFYAKDPGYKVMIRKIYVPRYRSWKFHNSKQTNYCFQIFKLKVDHPRIILWMSFNYLMINIWLTIKDLLTVKAAMKNPFVGSHL